MVHRDDRGVAPVIGFVLIFGFLAISFAVYQGVVVPDQNRAAEFDHNQQVQEQLQELRNAVRNAATTGTETSVEVQLEATYPRRTIARNLGLATGRVETVSHESGILVQNITASDPETADYFGASTTTIGPLPSKRLVYTPFYTQYANAPDTVYEHTVAYNRFDATNVTITDQTVIDGREITLIGLSGNLSEAGRGTVSVDTESMSAATEPVTVTDAGGPINVTVPSRLPASAWQSLLADEIDGGGDDGRYVTEVRQSGPSQVSILLEPGATYTLRLAKVGVGAVGAEEPRRYITTVAGDETSVVEGGRQQLVIEVRDRFNNPVSGVTVESELTVGAGGDLVTPTNATTDANGRASFTYFAPSDVNGSRGAVVTAYYDAPTPDNQSATFELTVLDADGSGEGSDRVGDLNPSGPGTISLESVSNVGGGGLEDVTVTLRNETGVAGTIEVTRARISFFYTGGNEPRPSTVVLNESSVDTGTTLTIGDRYAVLNEPIPLDPDTTTLQLSFDQKVEPKDYYVLSLRFERPDGKVDTYSYFVQHPV